MPCEVQWIYRYLRADREEIDMGPWDTQEEAQSNSDTHAKFGALCTGAVAVPRDYVLWKGEPDA